MGLSGLYSYESTGDAGSAVYIKRADTPAHFAGSVEGRLTYTHATGELWVASVYAGITCTVRASDGACTSIDGAIATGSGAYLRPLSRPAAKYTWSTGGSQFMFTPLNGMADVYSTGGGVYLTTSGVPHEGGGYAPRPNSVYVYQPVATSRVLSYTGCYDAARGAWVGYGPNRPGATLDWVFRAAN